MSLVLFYNSLFLINSASTCPLVLVCVIPPSQLALLDVGLDSTMPREGEAYH